ncbi:uncharacterized protein [Nicotiana tomentosiformis]|uniref:uncharacterized protein n=1 Tax=Nicotiana tomentosiformis TaxID=4098 RepID=UPI00388C6273
MPEDEQRRLERFRRLQPPYFSGAEGEDAKGFLDREELRKQFDQLCQDDMSVTQYEIRFSVLARHAIWLVSKDRERIKRESVSGSTFDEVVNIARQIEMVRSKERVDREAKRPRGQGGFCGAPSGGQLQHGRGRLFRHTQMARPVHRGASSGHGPHGYQQVQTSFGALPAQSSSHTPSAQGSSVPGPSSSYSSAQGFLQSLVAGRGCFECGILGHIKRFCPRLMGGSSQ